MTTEQQQPQVKRERGRGRLYHQQGSSIWAEATIPHKRDDSHGWITKQSFDRIRRLSSARNAALLMAGFDVVAAICLEDVFQHCTFLHWTLRLWARAFFRGKGGVCPLHTGGLSAACDSDC